MCKHSRDLAVKYSEYLNHSDLYLLCWNILKNQTNNLMSSFESNVIHRY